MGVKLGVVVGAAGDEDGGIKPPRSVQDITYHACRIHQQDPGAHPVLRFEVPQESDKFARLSQSGRCNLLRRWAKQQKQSAQAVDQFSIIYAFYVHALPDTPETYDSVFAEPSSASGS